MLTDRFGPRAMYSSLLALCSMPVCALIGANPVAIFYLPDEADAVYAIDNFDPIGRRECIVARHCRRYWR